MWVKEQRLVQFEHDLTKNGNKEHPNGKSTHFDILPLLVSKVNLEVYGLGDFGVVAGDIGALGDCTSVLVCAVTQKSAGCEGSGNSCTQNLLKIL